MRINWKTVSGVLAAAFAYDELVAVRNKKRYRKIHDQLKGEMKLSEDLYRHVRHLARKSDEHKLPVETFEIGLLSDFEERMGH